MCLISFILKSLVSIVVMLTIVVGCLGMLLGILLTKVLIGC